MEKAKYIGKTRDKNNRYAVHLLYEYKGHEYIITDEHNGYSETMKDKHKYEQEKIDALIASKNTMKKKPEYEKTADYGFDVFWQSVNE